MRSRSPERKHVGGDWATWITSLYVTASAFQSWPFPVCSQAAHYGCGCWAENGCNMSPYSTAVSTSGIPRTLSNSPTLNPPHPLPVYQEHPALYSRTDVSPNWSLMWVPFTLDEGSFKMPDNPSWWTTVPAKWFPSFISSDYWLVVCRLC